MPICLDALATLDPQFLFVDVAGDAEEEGKAEGSRY
jgi:hypothetical protein